MHTTQGRTPIHQFWFYQTTINTLKMGTGLVPETSEKHHILTQMSAWEHFIALQSFKTFSIKNLFLGKRETFPTNIFLQLFHTVWMSLISIVLYRFQFKQKSHGLWFGKHDGHNHKPSQNHFIIVLLRSACQKWAWYLLHKHFRITVHQHSWPKTHKLTYWQTFCDLPRYFEKCLMHVSFKVHQCNYQVLIHFTSNMSIITVEMFWCDKTHYVIKTWQLKW